MALPAAMLAEYTATYAQLALANPSVDGTPLGIASRRARLAIAAFGLMSTSRLAQIETLQVGHGNTTAAQNALVLELAIVHHACIFAEWP